LKSSKKIKPQFKPVFLLLFFLFNSVPLPAFNRQTVLVHETLTGDTACLNGGKLVKYIGLSSPPPKSAIVLVQEYGVNALEFNKSMVQGKKIHIEWDSQIRDDQNRLLGYVFLEDGTFLNEEILRQGHARWVFSPPNTRYSGVLRKAELEARRGKKGLWKKEPENPFIHSEYVGEKNTKIYYFPTSEELDRIPEANLVRFSSRVEATAAGYRPCSTCREKQEAFY
jgi:micrococcal nuclease